MSGLRVGVIAPAYLPVPPPSYGGTEAVLDSLALGLHRAGNEVVLFTTGDSTCPVERRYFHSRSLGTGASAESELLHVDAAYQALIGNVDVIHDHTLLGPIRRLFDGSPTPVVVTYHSPLTEQIASLYEAIARRMPLVAISEAQARATPAVPVAAVIHHGLDVADFPLGSGGGGYVAFLGRMSPDKGPHRAIVAARAAGVQIKIAAKMREPVEREFFTSFVKPLLGPEAEYVGELGPLDRACFLAEASALVNPVRWPEPFGMVMLEALACGTPVVAFPEGSIPEIVRDGLNGFLCDDEEHMAVAIRRVVAGEIDRSTCRASVRNGFSVAQMTERHVRLYLRSMKEWDARSGRLRGTTPAPELRSRTARAEHVDLRSEDGARGDSPAGQLTLTPRPGPSEDGLAGQHSGELSPAP